MYSAHVAWSQIVGARKNQQDFAAVVSWPNGFRLLLLADGMGGHVGGEVASKLVIETFKQTFIESQEVDMRSRLLASLEAANVAVYQYVKQNKELSGMGTTLIALVYDGLSIQWLSVGDSPMWLVRANMLKRLNENHSMSEVLAEQVSKGEITEHEARTSPIRSQLTEAVMGENIEIVDAPFHTIELQEQDCLILASDGVETCPLETITALASDNSLSAEGLSLQVLGAVEQEERPKQDNATLIILKIESTNVEEPITVQPETSDCVEEPSTQQ